MKKIISMLILALAVSIMFMPSKTLADEIPTDCTELTQQINIPMEKEWTVKFNMQLKPETINSENIKVYKNGESNYLSVSVRPGKNADEAIIGSPASGYVPGRTYYLIISENVQAVSGKTLSKPVKMKFVVNNTFENSSKYSDLPNITSCTYGSVPFVQDQKLDFNLCANSGQVQYRVFIHDYAYSYDNYSEITSGYTVAADGSSAFNITANNNLDAGANGKKYKLLVFVKRANTEGSHSTNISGVGDIDFDNYYVDYFRVVSGKATISQDSLKSYSYTLENIMDKQAKVSPKTDEGDGSSVTVTPNTNMLKYYLNPDNFMDDYGKYMFLRLDSYTDISVDSINALLKGAGVLDGKGQAFLDAAKLYNINPAYLVSHALLETGLGTSALSKGVTIQGKTVYNFFGIQAVDNNVLGGGSGYAYGNGWFTPQAAISGGAKYISTKYIHNASTGQYTLYNMRWNPNIPATTQYATDVAWQFKILKNFSALMTDVKSQLKFEVPVYLK